MSLPAPDAFKTIRLSGDRRDALMAHARATLYTPASGAGPWGPGS